MKKVLTGIWFWLMLIFIVLLIGLLIQLGVDLCILKMEVFWVATGSLLTFFSVLVAVSTYCHSENVRKKQATYDAYNEFKNRAFELENKIHSYDLKDVLEKKKSYGENKNIMFKSDEWNTIKDYLTQVERIATCVNADIFDVKTIYNMGGPFMIKMYSQLEQIIKYKRKDEQSNGVYEEFENMVKSLQKIESTRKD